MDGIGWSTRVRAAEQGTSAPAKGKPSEVSSLVCMEVCATESGAVAGWHALRYAQQNLLRYKQLWRDKCVPRPCKNLAGTCWLSRPRTPCRPGSLVKTDLAETPKRSRALRQ